MKRVAMGLALCLWVNSIAFAESSIFRHDDSGFTVDLPSGFKHSWKFTNFDSGLEVDVFDMAKENSVEFAIIGQLPLNDIEWFNEGDFFSEVLQTVQEIFSCEEKDFIFDYKELPLVGIKDEHAKHFRFYICPEEGASLAIDTQVFCHGNYAFMTLTGTCPTDKNAEDLDQFTEMLSHSIRYIAN